MQYCKDSPIFAKSVDSFSNETDNLSEFLKCLVQLMKKFCSDLKNLSQLSQALSIQMIEGFQSSTKHRNLIPIISTFGKVFEEISSSQDILSDSLEQTFIKPLELFYSNTILAISNTRQQYIQERKNYSDSLIKYLHSDTSNIFSRGGIPSNHIEYRALEVVSNLKALELVRFDLVRHINEIEAKKSFELSETCISAMYNIRTHHRECNERINSLTTFSDDYILSIQNERKQYIENIPTLDRERSDIESVLNIMIERVENQLASNYNTSSNYGSLENIFLPSKDIDSRDDLIPSNIASAASHFSKWIGFSSSSNSLKTNVNISSQNSVNEQAYSVVDTEIRMKSLDKSELYSYYNENVNDNFSNASSIIKQGFVLERNIPFGKVLQLIPATWSRRWLVLDETKLYFVKEGESLSDPLEIQPLCDIILSSVRELSVSNVAQKHSTSNVVELPFCFEIVYANMKNFTIQAEGLKDYQSWISCIRQAIERRLIAGPTHQPMSRSISPETSIESNVMDKNCDYPSTESNYSTENQTEHISKAKLIHDLLKVNNYCADCNKSNPEWLSLNLGILICIECSGIHRSLGVHISKVRSITLDDLDYEDYLLLTKLGNHINHTIWEAKMIYDEDGNSDRKTRPHSDPHSREAFIRQKYIKKDFVQSNDEEVSLLSVDEKLRKHSELLLACKNNEVHLVLKLVVLYDQIFHDLNGYEIGLINSYQAASSSKYESDFAFESPFAVSIQFGSIECIVLLIHLGYDVSASILPNPNNITGSSREVVENMKLSVTEIAKKFNQTYVFDYLSRKVEVSSKFSVYPRISLDLKSCDTVDDGLDVHTPLPAVLNNNTSLRTRTSRSASQPVYPNFSTNPTSPSFRSDTNQYASKFKDIGEKFHNASESNSSAGKVFDKLYTTTDAQVDKLKSGFSKVFKHTSNVIGHIGQLNATDTSCSETNTAVQTSSVNSKSQSPSSRLANTSLSTSTEPGDKSQVKNIRQRSLSSSDK